MRNLSTIERVLTTTALCALLCGCDTPPPDGVLVELAPDVVSSAEGSIHVRTLVVDDRSPRSNELVRLEVLYVDRNGDALADTLTITTATGIGNFIDQGQCQQRLDQSDSSQDYRIRQNYF